MMGILDKLALLLFVISVSALDSESYIPFGVCALCVSYLLVRVLRGDIDV